MMKVNVEKGSKSPPLDHVHSQAPAERSFDDNGLTDSTSDNQLPARPPDATPRRIANPAPLGLCGFALTTFLLSLINLGTQGITEPNIIIGAAFAYGGLCQLLAGMWEMACGNTVNATAFGSFGGFWVGTAIILTPGFHVVQVLEVNGPHNFLASFALYLFGWFIFCFLVVLCTIKTNLAQFVLFFTLDMTFLLLGIAYILPVDGRPMTGCLKAGGAFGVLAAFSAWYVALAGMAEASKSFKVPLLWFPWSVRDHKSPVKAINAGDPSGEVA